MNQAATAPAQARFLSLVRRRGIHGLGLMFLLSMELAWFVPWFRSLTAATRALTTLQSMALFLSVSAVTVATSRVLQSGDIRLSIQQGALLILLTVSFVAGLRIVVFRGSALGLFDLVVQSFTSFASVLTIVPSELIVVLSMLYAWRRGIVASGAHVLDPGATAYRFRLGIMALVVYALVHRAESGGLMLEILPFYFGSGLAAVALSRADSLSHTRGAGRSPFTGQWLAAMLLLAAVTTGIGVLAGAWLRSSSTVLAFDRAGSVLFRLLELLVLLISPVILALVWLGEWILGALHLSEGLGTVFSALRRVLPGPAFEPRPERESLLAWLQPHLPWIKIAGTSLVIAVLALAAIRGARRARRPLPEPEEDAGDSLLTPNALLTGLRQTLGRMAAGWGSRRFGSARRLLAATAIRRIYARLLLLAEQEGRARYPAETPLEYLAQLRKLFPNREAEVSTITHAYIQVRYGGFPEAEATIAQVRESWAALRQDAKPARTAGEGGAWWAR